MSGLIQLQLERLDHRKEIKKRLKLIAIQEGYLEELLEKYPDEIPSWMAVELNSLEEESMRLQEELDGLSTNM